MTKVESYYWGDHLVLVYPECPHCLPGAHDKTRRSAFTHRCHHPKNNQVYCDVSHHKVVDCPFNPKDAQFNELDALEEWAKKQIVDNEFDSQGDPDYAYTHPDFFSGIIQNCDDLISKIDEIHKQKNR